MRTSRISPRFNLKLIRCFLLLFARLQRTKICGISLFN